MDETSNAAALEKLMNGHLVFWLKSCLVDSDRLQDFSDLVDGPLIYEVLQQIDPDRNPSNQIQESHGNHSVRLKNLDIVLESLKTIYRDDIGALILASPDIVTLSLYNEQSSKDMDSLNRNIADEARLLLVLLLGAAVQCSEKENFILKIKSLPLDIQLCIVENIKEVTESRTVVVSIDGSETCPGECLVSVTSTRDAYLLRYVELMTRHERDMMAVSSKHKLHTSVSSVHAATALSSEQHQQNASMHLVVEIADWKSKIRKKNQELEEKCESLLECREELENTKALVSKLKQEVTELSADARSAKMYRDELDAVRLKAERCERLEAELGRARDKLRELEYLKGLTSELRGDNRMLVERTQELEEQLSRSRARSGAVIDLEAQIARLKQTLLDSTQEREELQEKVRDLIEENTQLQLRQLSASKADNNKTGSQELDPNLTSSGVGSSLLDQLASSAQSEVVRLSMENSRLRAELDGLRENLSLEKASLETALDNEKKKSALKVEEILSGERVHRQLQATLEETVRELTHEKKELGSQLQDSAINSQQLATQLQESKQQIMELSDKVSHLESIQRANEVLWEAEKTKLVACQRELSLVRSERDRAVENLTTKTSHLENEITKRREFENRSTELKAALKVAKENVQRSSEYEQQLKEFVSKSEMLENSLRDLQNELYLEKLDKEKFSSYYDTVYSNLKSIANIDTSDKTWMLDRDLIIKRLASNSELIKELTDHCKNSTNENGTDKKIQSQEETSENTDGNKFQEVAQLQVQVSILESQVSSLQNQQTVQQLANSQLAAEKEELSRQLETQCFQTTQISQDLANLQKIHESLASEYEMLRTERESSRSELKSCQRELRLATEQINALKLTNQDQELLRMEAKTLANLRAEHSKLKEDFRQLFSASERLKMEARSRDDELRRTRVELGAMRLTARQLSSALENEKEVNARLSARLTRADTKLQLLVGVAHSLEEDRRSLMTHVTSLLGQYHELLSNSMEDKEFFHSQEKIFLERLNGLMRQKENLEQKIMDHYRRLDSCSAKKKGFGSSFVKKVRKAGSDIINKVPRARSRSRNTTDEAETSIASESGTRESEHSSDETMSEHGGLGADSDTDTSLSLGSVGTRRAIYYDEPTTPTSATTEPANGNGNTEPKERNLLVFNKVSAVIGTTNIQSPGIPVPVQPPDVGQNLNEQTNEQKTESSVWYEYGCV